MRIKRWLGCCTYSLVLLGGSSTLAAGGPECPSASVEITQLFNSGWGIDSNNQRFQTNTDITAANVATLQLQWAYKLATDAPRSYPLVSADTLFIGDGDRGLVALDRRSGCQRWRNSEPEEVSTAIVPATIDGQSLLLFADRYRGVYAVNAGDGKTLWRYRLPHQRHPMYSGSPVVVGDMVLVPVSSKEIGLALNPFFGCCRGSGAMVALSLHDGSERWYLPTITTAPAVTGRHFLLVREWGPSGAPVWTTPLVDAAARRVYFGTGQNYSAPATDTSDAIFAVDIDNGSVVWRRQFTAGDTYNISCEASHAHPNCPPTVGPDFDFGAPPLQLALADGSQIIVVGQKSGDIYALKPDDGSTLWQQRIGGGSKLGGVHWGMAADQALGIVYVPISDIELADPALGPQPGVYALNAATGEILWRANAVESGCDKRACWPGISAALTAAPGLVVVPALNGQLAIHGALDGSRLWSTNTAQSYTPVNARQAKGGSLDAHGALLAGNQLIISSGYGSFGQGDGNALLVYQLAPNE